jgi:hypothetical protein
MKSISLYGEWGGWHNDQEAYFANNLLDNPGFENGVSGGIANQWSVQSDGSIGYTASQDAGVIGSAQKIEVTSSGSWGLLYYQEPGFQLGQWYTASFDYKTSGSGDVGVQVADPPRSVIVLNEILSGTAGQWSSAEYTFQYDNSAANQFRFYMSEPATLWLDNVQLEIGQDAHSFSDSPSQTSTSHIFSKTLPEGTYEWNCLGENSAGQTVWGEAAHRIVTIQGCHRADVLIPDCCIDINEIVLFIGDWKQGLGGITMAELMDGIGFYNSGAGCPEP